MQSLINKLVAIIILTSCLPLLIVIGLLILFIEQDRIFFLQNRLGKKKTSFTIYKFRTMKNGKITLFGKILRKTGLDEIPQLINIIKGDITFIGPRPLTQFDIERLNWTSDFHSKRWDVKPGLTGLAQLSPICNKKMTLFWDKYYVEHKNLTLNIKIISASVLSLIIGKKRIKIIIQKKIKR